MLREVARAFDAVATIVTPNQAKRGRVLGIVEGYVYVQDAEGYWVFRLDDITDVLDVQRPTTVH